MSRILIVDDDADIRDLVCLKLGIAGHDVIAQADGEAGLATALSLRPDLLLLDWMMPRLSGLEVCRRLRSSEACAATTVILLTAKAQEADVALGLEAGADDYIVKPFSPRELVSRVDAALGRPSA